ncbi:MAG: beta-xylosidase, partial [Sphingobacteriaceae bacterium]
YYATGTSSEWAPHFPVFSSTDLVNWKQTGYIFDTKPEWTSSSFWAPEYYFHNNTYYIYYTARRKSDGLSFIGVATSKFPDHGFKDHGTLIVHGKEAIDAFVFNDNGQLYITWKAYGLEQRPIEILGSKLSDDGLSLIGEPFTLLRDDERIGLEGQSIIKKGEYYYVFYSAGDCCGGGCSYNVRIARSKDIHGPYEYYAQNPVLSGDDTWKCTGHGTFVNSTDGNTYYLHHGYSKKNDVFTGRQGLLSQLVWPANNGWPEFKQPSFIKNIPVNTTYTRVTDNFKGNVVSNAWQWDFRHSSPQILQQAGKLKLSGTVTKDNPTGIALTRRPVSANYTMRVTVTNNNAALKGLTIYGDASAAIGIGVVNNKVEFWQVKDNVKTVLKSTTVAANKLVKLKIAANSDNTCRVYWNQSGKWNELTDAAQPQSIGFLPPWDRSPRPGLIFNGTVNQEAIFSNFEIAYTL